MLAICLLFFSWWGFYQNSPKSFPSTDSPQDKENDFFTKNDFQSSPISNYADDFYTPTPIFSNRIYTFTEEPTFYNDEKAMNQETPRQNFFPPTNDFPITEEYSIPDDL